MFLADKEVKATLNNKLFQLGVKPCGRLLTCCQVRIVVKSGHCKERVNVRQTIS